MKKIISIAFTLFLMAGLANAQISNDVIKERKKMAKMAQTELKARSSKVAIKESKKLAKEGWAIAAGQLPLEKQLDKSYEMQYQYEESGFPKFVFGDAMSPGKTYDAAKSQALILARENLAAQIQAEVTTLVESTVSNEQISSDDAESVVRTIQVSKDLINQSLGRVIPVIECHRTLPNKSVEVRIVIAYNSKMALDSAKRAVKAKLEEDGNKLADELDSIWSSLN